MYKLEKANILQHNNQLQMVGLNPKPLNIAVMLAKAVSGGAGQRSVESIMMQQQRQQR